MSQGKLLARMRGVGSLGALAVLLCGVPTALVLSAGPPVPRAVQLILSGRSPWHEVISWFLSPVGPALLRDALVGASWLAWVWLVVCGVTEAVAIARGRPARRLPGSKPVQAALAFLLAGVLALAPSAHGAAGGARSTSAKSQESSYVLPAKPAARSSPASLAGLVIPGRAHLEMAGSSIAPNSPSEPPGASAASDSHHDDPSIPLPVVPIASGLLGAALAATAERVRRARQRNGIATAPSQSGLWLERDARSAATAGDARALAGALCALAKGARPKCGPAGLIWVNLGRDAIELHLLQGESSRLSPYWGMHSKVAKPPMTAWEVVTTVRSEAAKHCPPSWPIDGRFSIACPSMVTLGHDSAGSVVINLEALGALGICGQGRELQALLLAMATELAASSWSKGLEVILVGFDRVLGVCERVRVVDALPEALPGLARRAIVAARLLKESGFSCASAGRLAGDSDAWEPVVVVCAEPPSNDDAASLVRLVGDGRFGLCAVFPVGECGQASSPARFVARLESNWITLDGLGMDRTLRPESLRTNALIALGELLATSGEVGSLSIDQCGVSDPYRPCQPSISLHQYNPTPVGGPLPEMLEQPVPTEVEQPVPTEIEQPVPTEIEVKILGPVEISGAERPLARAWTTELVVYLALHPGGVANEIWATALWPDRLMAPASLHSTASAARRCLGQAGDGSDFLPRSHGQLALSKGVSTDWDLFCRLSTIGTPRGWESAMELIRGRPFEGLRSGDWTVLEGFVAEIEAAVVSTASLLAEHHLATANPSGAEWAARQGLKVSRYDERLYRLLMRAADLAGNPAGVEAAMVELAHLVADDVEPFDVVHPETLELYRRLMRDRPAVSSSSH